jgi:asparagine synthase (glutamine-hydrolysing)
VLRGDGSAVQGHDLAAMAASLAHRGRDAVGRWSDGPVGLAHCLLATTHASLALSHPVADATGTCRLVWDGRLDNRDALGARPDEPDERVVLRAYGQWGDALPERLLGDFAFALWDGSRRRLLCARDRMGLKPFLYMWHRGVFRFASETAPLLPWLERREPDDAMVLALLLREFRPGDEARTLLSGLNRLPPGHRLVVNDIGIRVERYWGLDPARTVDPGSEADTSALFRTLLREAVSARLRTDWPIGALLSGGLDSSALVATAAALYDERGEGSPPLETFTLFADHPAGDEREPARAVSDAAGLKGHAVRRLDADPLDGLDAEVAAAESPIVDPSHHTMAACLQLVAAGDCRILISGEGGDQLLDEHGAFADLLRCAQPLAFAREVRGFARRYGASPWEVAVDAAMMLAPPAVKYWGKRLLRGVPARWLKAETAAAVDLRARIRSPRHTMHAASWAQWDTYLSLTSPYYGLKLEAEERRAARAGLEMRYPLLDSRLVAFVLALPWQRRRGRGERKRLLRAAMADVLAPRALQRNGKGDWTQPIDRALAAMCAQPGAAESRSGLRDRYVDPAAARRIVRRFREGERELRWDVWFLVTVDRWLEGVAKGVS